jgi:hypothetical protein
MIPLSYNGFGPTAILIMVLCLVISQAYKFYRDRKSQTHKEELKK